MKKVILFLLVILLITFSSIVYSETIAKFNWDATNGTDTQLRSDLSTTNFGTAVNVYVGAADNPWDITVLMQWINTTKSIPVGSTINWVRLQVYIWQETGSNDNTIYPMKISWGEEIVTYDSLSGCPSGSCYNSTNVIGYVPDWGGGGIRFLNITLNTTWYQRLLDEGDNWEWSKGIYMIGQPPAPSNANAQIRTTDYYSTSSLQSPTLWVNYTEGVPGVPGAPVAPTIESPSPANGTIINTNQTLNVSHDTVNNDVRYYLYFDTSSTLDEGDLIFNNVTRNASEYSAWTTGAEGDGEYFWKFRVQNISSGVFSANTTQRSFTIDTVTPTITINPTNAFNTSNISSHNQYLNFMFLNISFNDETGLFGASINVTQDEISYFNYTNVTLNNALSHNFTRNISTLLWPDGVFDIEVTVADGSTVMSIDDYEISQFLSRITFDTKEGNKVDIIGSGAISTEYIKKKDRYEFGFNYLTKETTKKFTVKCDNKLFYMDNPNKVGHFVCWNGGSKTGNWIDFEGIGDSYIVKKINDKEYDITFTNLPYSNQVLIKSIGGLNVVTENYQWFKGSTTNIFLSTATSGSEQDFEMNITLDFDLVENITATFSYNDSSRTVTRTDSASSILFSSTFSVPDVNQTLNLSWILNVSQRNNALYLFSVNSTQELVSPQVNLTILDEENQTLITEDLTIFFSGPTSIQTNTSSGTLTIGNLLLGEYFIQAESTSYPRRGVFFTVTNASSRLNLYLVRDVTGNEFIDYIVQDDGRNRLNDVRLTFQKNINNSFVTVAQVETDFAGQARIFQDQQNEYQIIMFLAGFETQTINLIPLLTTYTLTLLTLPEQLFQTTYEGIRYTISPAARVLNASGNFEDISITIFDSTSSLEFFGLQIINHSYECSPTNCITNITGSPAGGTATVQIKLNATGSFDTLYFFKRNGFPLQFINGQRSSVRFLIGDRLADNFATIGENLGTPVMRAIFAAILITVLCVLASQMGIIGLGLIMVISFGTIFFMLLGFIPRMVAMITLFFGIAIYFVLGRES